MISALDTLVTALRAAGEGSRLRILALLRQGDFSVGELVEILGQSQPGVSQHLKTLTGAGLVERLPEGAFVYYRLTRNPDLRRLIDHVLEGLDPSCADIRRDSARLEAVRSARADSADTYFDLNARSWDELRATHYPGVDIEAAVLEAVGAGPYDRLIDIGTGTGRILSLLAPRVKHAEGIDRSHEMLTVARANLDRDGVRHASVRKGEATALPIDDASADLVVIHQVLHYVPNPGHALAEAARIMRPGGRLIVVDFAPHDLVFLRDDHAHFHLGLDQAALGQWAGASGFKISEHRLFEPENGTGLPVQILTAIKQPDMEKAAA